ncbi:MAG TPA: response regulator transcription factor [Solirubrobacteraceae bacterium]|nr:response regulator transcription factor [Solirubrobacteraceae bacterium]
MIRVLVADDQALVRSGLSAILDAQDDIEVVGEADDGDAAVERARELEPDVVVMDIRMPRMDGIEATRHLQGARVLILTTFDLDEYVYGALKAGAAGFVLKDTPPERLAAAVRAVASGDQLFAPEVTRRLVESYVARPMPAEPETLDELTPREREVVLLVAKGLSNQEVGERLFLSEATVKTHLTSILRKLGLRDRTQLVVLAYERGLVTPGAAG